MRFQPLAAAIACFAVLLTSAESTSQRPVQRTWVGNLTLDQAINLALKQNPLVLKALQQIEATRGQIIEVRAEALPHVALTSSYFQQSKTLLSSRASGTARSSARRA